MADPLYDSPAPDEVTSPELMPEEDPGADLDQRLLVAIRAQESTAYGSDGTGELNTDRARAIDDYLGQPYGNEVEGRSQVVARDVHDTIEWIKPSLLRIFTAGDEVARFDPVGPEDEDGAAQETDYINYVIAEKNNWFATCYEWFTDGLMTKNAYALAYWDNSRQIESEKYQGLTDEQFTLLMQDAGVELVSHGAQPAPVPPEVQQQIMQARGQGIMVPDPMLHDAIIRRTREYKGVKICALPPERCLVAEDVATVSVRVAPFFQYWEMVTISKLRSMGFSVPDDISDEGGADDSEEAQARDLFNEERDRYGAEGGDASMRKVKLRLTWIQHDYDGDGLAEHRMVMHVGDTIFYNEEVNGVHVACLVPTPLPHRHPGLSVHDAVEDLQLIKTTIWRQLLDNLYLANNGRNAISDKVDLSDMLTSRPGGVVRVTGGIPSQEIFPFTHPFIAGQALSVMEYMDRMRESRTGTGQAFTGVDPNALQKSHSGVAIAQLSSAAAQRIELIARVFAEGVKELFLIVHELCIKHGHKAEVVKLRNKWVTINPSQWKRRADMRISVGLGTGNKEQLMANLMMIAQGQEKLMPTGMVKPKHLYSTFSELIKAAGFASPAKFVEEPQEGQEMPQTPSPDQVLAQTEIQKETLRQQAETRRTAMEIQSKEKIESWKLMQGDKNKLLEFNPPAMQEMAEKAGQMAEATAGNLQAAIAQLSQSAGLVAQSAQAITQAGQAMAQAFDQFVKMSDAEEILVRDKTGRALGKKRVPSGTLNA